MMVLAGVILFPLKSFRSWIHRVAHRSRVLSLYARWMQWRHERARPRKDR